jgi:multicomponent Na+:H+ antiporter subunit F
VNILYSLSALILLVAIAMGMLRILLGPTAADRMMSAQLFGTSGIAILLVLAKGMEKEVLLDIALVFALLAVLATMTFIRRTWHHLPEKEEPNA